MGCGSSKSIKIEKSQIRSEGQPQKEQTKSQPLIKPIPVELSDSFQLKNLPDQNEKEKTQTKQTNNKQQKAKNEDGAYQSNI